MLLSKKMMLFNERQNFQPATNESGTRRGDLTFNCSIILRIEQDFLAARFMIQKGVICTEGQLKYLFFSVLDNFLFTS